VLRCHHFPSGTAVTAILNRNTKAVTGFQGLYFTNPEVKTDLLLCLLYALGFTAKITFKSAA
jgi:hypothetical protein